VLLTLAALGRMIGARRRAVPMTAEGHDDG
jgi:hypothetical protein